MSASVRVFIIDDDDAVRASLRMLLESAGFEVCDYTQASTFLEHCAPGIRGCVISDLQMPGLDGLQLQSRLEQRGIAIPMIMLTGHADVAAAVRSLKAGAVDFIEKPFDPGQLIAQVRVALELDERRHAASEHEARREHLLARLTPREREVVERVTRGHSNKAVAADLGISERTVELHRAHGMQKLELRNIAELVRFLGDASTGSGARSDSSAD